MFTRSLICSAFFFYVLPSSYSSFYPTQSLSCHPFFYLILNFVMGTFFIEFILHGMKSATLYAHTMDFSSNFHSQQPSILLFFTINVFIFLIEILRDTQFVLYDMHSSHVISGQYNFTLQFYTPWFSFTYTSLVSSNK